ncbi:MAG: PEP-CTERM system histidine kinase PrsK [Colwellia sp.]
MHIIGFWGYSFASLAYVVFALLIFAARNHSILARWILFSAIIAFAANITGALQIKLGFSLQWAMLADAIKIAVFSVLILSFNSEQQTIKTLLTSQRIRKYLVFWLVSTLVCWGLSNGFDSSYKYLFLLFVLLNLATLVLLEQLFRGTNSETRRAVSPIVIAVGGVAVFDFVLYAQATMVGGIDFDFWFSRGYLAAFIVPLLLISTRRVKEGSVRIFVSRHVVFYSSMLMIAGLYLLLMATAGYLINYFGGKWGNLVSVGFLMLGGIVLAVLLVTESIRRQVKVFIAKNFFANKYEYRDEWLQLIEKIETSSAENYYQMATKIMMSKIEASGGAILKRTTVEQFTIQYSENLVINSRLKNDLMLLGQFCQNQGWIIDINEYDNDPLSYPGLFIKPKLWREINVNILVPIFIGKSFYGFFVLSKEGEQNEFNWEDRDLLFAISKQLGNFISLNEVNDTLAESKQFDAFNQMSAFLVHDLKNVQAQLALITSNAKNHRDNPEFIDDVFETVDSATQRLAKVLTQLRNKQVAQSVSKSVELGAIIEQVVKQRNVNQPQVSFEAHTLCKIELDHERFFSVMNHLIQNAQEATESNGWVDVSLQVEQGHIQIKVSDNGCGMSAEFIKQRLFKPFDTTKGNAGMGIGVFEAKQFFESISGTLTVKSTQGQGTSMLICLPL